MKLTYKRYIDIAHRLANYIGKHVNVHGHTLLVVIDISGNMGKSGMIIDTDELKKVIDKYDHTILLRECRSNEDLIDAFTKWRLQFVLMNYEPTLENIAKQISEEIVELGCKHVKNVTVQIKVIDKEVIYFGFTRE